MDPEEAGASELAGDAPDHHRVGVDDDGKPAAGDREVCRLPAGLGPGQQHQDMRGDGEPRGDHVGTLKPHARPGSAPAGGNATGMQARAAAVRLASARLCAEHGWAALHEVALPNGRRADLLALRPDGGFVCIEVKSCARDFLVDGKWPEYREYADALYFAVDADFPRDLLPFEAGLIVACDGGAEVLREPTAHPMAPARRRALLLRFAQLGAARLHALTDPAGWTAARSALLCE